MNPTARPALPDLGLQGQLDFSVRHAVQTTWRAREALTFALEGSGAALYCLALLADRVVGQWLGLALLFAGALLLLSHLGSPRRLVYVLANLRHSWMSRGAAAIMLFLALGGPVTLYATLHGASPDGMPGALLDLLFVALGLFVLVKSGLVMATLRGIPFWNGGMLPLLFAMQGAASGLLLFLALTGTAAELPAWVASVACLLLLAVTLVFVMTAATQGRAAAVSVQLLGARHAIAFYLVGIGVGIVAPLLLLAVMPASGNALLWWAAVAGRLAGDVALRVAIVAAGVYEKVL